MRVGRGGWTGRNRKAAISPRFNMTSNTLPPSLPIPFLQVVVPAISILTVIGIIPFASSVARQIWVRRERAREGGRARSRMQWLA